MHEVDFAKRDILKLPSKEYWKDEKLLHSIEEVGFRNIDWNDVPNDILLYLFLHDQPTIGEKRAESTKKEYFRDLKQFLEYINEKGFSSLHSLNPEHLLQYQRYLENKYKKTTLLRKSSVIKHFFRYLANKEILLQDITRQMKRPKVNSEELVNRDLFDHEVKQILAYFKKTDWFAYTLFYLLVSTGMRINELATAKWSNFRYEPSVDHFFLKVMGKGGKVRDIIIFNDVLEVVKENRRRKSLNTQIGTFCGTAFFPKANGKHYHTTYLSNEFTRVVNTAPLDFIQARFEREKEALEGGQSIKYRITPHTCRHYTAAYYMDNGIDPKALQDMLGHSSLMTTERYLRRKRSVESHAGVKLGENNFLKTFK
ncbi:MULTISPECIES: tyrosine-type recombinase/integrase [Cytobacillus]|uniref:tyrosine-type recombinase/integrase n=1 Tax=Cytobacillus TaxID=2675230 RepID=UPI0001F44ABD|nr:tyrosine-type recombinase/integrase [Cytobacillus oceanisediminis]EFV75018.1 hypothetical protein HMPREF1013_04791 [Bacillus sp. 2_A_57_CT2]